MTHPVQASVCNLSVSSGGPEPVQQQTGNRRDQCFQQHFEMPSDEALDPGDQSMDPTRPEEAAEPEHDPGSAKMSQDAAIEDENSDIDTKLGQTDADVGVELKTGDAKECRMDAPENDPEYPDISRESRTAGQSDVGTRARVDQSGNWFAPFGRPDNANDEVRETVSDRVDTKVALPTNNDATPVRQAVGGENLILTASGDPVPSNVSISKADEAGSVISPSKHSFSGFSPSELSSEKVSKVTNLDAPAVHIVEKNADSRRRRLDDTGNVKSSGRVGGLTTNQLAVASGPRQALDFATPAQTYAISESSSAETGLPTAQGEDPVQRNVEQSLFSTRPSEIGGRANILGDTSAPVRLDTMRPIVPQIVDALGKLADGSVVLKFSPEELGHVRMALSGSDSGFHLTITSDRAETIDLMRRHADNLIDELRRLGFESVDLEFSHGGSSFLAKSSESGDSPKGNDMSEGALGSDSAALHLRIWPSSGLDIRI